jgi:ribosomal-protein-alanine N-acetyltransferase
MLPLDFTLTTKRCRLRAPSEADFPHIFSATRFPGFNEGMLWEPPASFDEMRGPLARALEAWRTGAAYTFTLELLDGTFLGRVSLRRTNEPGIWSLGYWLHPEVHGKGYMTEAGEAMLALGFERLDAKFIEAAYATWNAKSRGVMLRLGMTDFDFLPQGFKKRGEWVPEYRMRIARAAWDAARE